MTIGWRSPSVRLSALALVAIVVPAAVVAVLGYVSLRQWAASAELLFREQVRDMAAMAAEKVEMVLRHQEDAFLDRVRSAVAAGPPSAAALDEAVRSAPLVRSLYLLDRQRRLVYPRAWREGDEAVVAGVLAEIPDAVWERGGRREILAGDQPCLAVGLAAADGSPLLALVARDIDALRRGVLEATLGPLESPTILAVLDHRDRAVYSRGSLEGAEPVLAVGFPRELPNWRLAVYQTPGTSTRAAVRRQVAVFTGAFGVLVGIIVAGIVLTYRLMRRETEMARLKSDFVANVSHDLRTPLSVIRMYGETLEMGRVPDEARRQEYFRVITRESERLSRLIDNVLDFSRIESGRRRYQPAPTAVEPLVRETLEAFAHPLGQQGFKVEVDVAPDLPELSIDREAVGQALGNLIDNAIKYSAEDRALTVEARVVGAELGLTVADRGLGIPRAEHARIFEKFYRVGESDTQGRRGSGVGLALVRHVVEAHGGRVTVDSAPGAGSRFTLWLPLGRGGGGTCRAS